MIPPLQILGYSIVPAADAIKLQSSSCFTFHMDGPWFSSSQRGWHSLDNYPTVVLLLLSCILDPSVARQVTAQMRKAQFVFQNSVWQAKALARTTTELAAKVAHNPALETLWSHFLLLDFTKAMSASIELRHCICIVVWAFLLPFFLSLIDTLHSGNIR